jgi:excinuclease UvrABC ATPase subunit
MTASQAVEFLANIPVIRRKLETLCAVGLGYITLGQSATTLSGGEVLACGTPETVAQSPASHTGRYLRPYLARQGA